jgi:hypothetical protein
LGKIIRLTGCVFNHEQQIYRAFGGDLFSIHSVSSDREFIFSNRDGEFFNFELKDHEISAAIKVSTYTDDNGLNNLFKELSSFEKPWQGTRSWRSLEGEFELTVSCATLGQVTFVATLHSYPGNWQVQTEIETELGQLPQIAKKANMFFQGKDLSI